MISRECNKVYVVMNNTDRTEGRGNEYVYAVTELLSTALRVSKGLYVQGTDCPIFEQKFTVFDGVKYLPITGIPFILPTQADIDLDRKISEKLARDRLRQDIIDKAFRLGLTKDEIAILHDDGE